MPRLAGTDLNNKSNKPGAKKAPGFDPEKSKQARILLFLDTLCLLCHSRVVLLYRQKGKFQPVEKRKPFYTKTKTPIDEMITLDKDDCIGRIIRTKTHFGLDQVKQATEFIPAQNPHALNSASEKIFKIY